MKSPIACCFEGIRTLALYVAAMIVPRNQREEWLQEWRSETWHASRESGVDSSTSWQLQLQMTMFCSGAFQDALCIARLASKRRISHSVLRRSPAMCTLVLATLLAATYSASLLLPGVRSEQTLSTYRVGPGLILIQDSESFNRSLPSITQVQYRRWAEHNQQYFDGFAFYRVVHECLNHEAASPISARGSRWNIAHATPNFFRLLQLPVWFAPKGVSRSANIGSVILSESRWRKEFGADTHLTGRSVLIGGNKVMISGVVPDGLSGLPGKVDAWILEPNPLVASRQPGYVVAHLSASGQSLMHGPQHRIVAHYSRIGEDDLLGISLHGTMPDSFDLFLFGLLLSLFAIPVTSLTPLPGYSAVNHGHSRSRWFLRCLFLASKIALLTPMAYFASLDLAYGSTALPLSMAMYVQVSSAFLISLFGFRWAFQDQRQRCPVCLHHVVLPARVGCVSRTFLAWNGIELMCPGGHTLLHIPDLPTSWFSSPQWLYLDSSWACLFPNQSDR